MRERGPWEAEIPLADLAALGLPTLVVSGAHHPAFEAICDVLERELRAERVVDPGLRPQPPALPRLHRRAPRRSSPAPPRARALARSDARRVRSEP